MRSSRFEEACVRIFESAFPLSTIRWIGKKTPRFGTEADIIYRLSPDATLGGASSPTTPTPHIRNIIDMISSQSARAEVPFYATGTTLGDTARYSTIGTVSDAPIHAPRLNPRQLHLDAVVFIPGFEMRDLGSLVRANLVRHLPRIDGGHSNETKRVPTYVQQAAEKERDSFFPTHGLRLLSDCIELVLSPESDPTDVATLYIGFANPGWSVKTMNCCVDTGDRSAQRVALGFSRETLRRSLPSPILQASNILTHFSNRSLPVPARLEPAFWLNATLLSMSRGYRKPSSIVSEIVLASLEGNSMPPVESWGAEEHHRTETWTSLLHRKVVPPSVEVNFSLVTDRKSDLLAREIAQQVLFGFTHRSYLMGNTSLLPTERFPRRATEESIKLICNSLQKSPPNFLSGN